MNFPLPCVAGEYAAVVENQIRLVYGNLYCAYRGVKLLQYEGCNFGSPFGRAVSEAD